MKGTDSENGLGTKPIFGSFNLIMVLAMLGMPLVHIMESCMNMGILSEDIGDLEKFITALTVFGPSVFMICMGIGFVSNSTPRRLFKFGIQMIIINVALNIIRFVFPVSLLFLCGKTTWQLPLLSLISSDIYYFVGLFCILYSVLKKAKRSCEKIFLISVLMLLSNVLICTFVYSEIPFLADFAGNFVSVSFDSYFPLLGWSIYPCIGIIIKERIFSLERRSRNVAFAVLLAVGTAISAITVVWIESRGKSIISELSDFAVESVYGFSQVGLILGISLVTVAVFYFIYQSVKENRFEKYVISFASLILPFYVIQWLCTSLVTFYPVAFANLLFGESFRVNTISYCVLSAVVLVFSLVITYKFGFSLTKSLFRFSDYTRWGKKESVGKHGG